MAGLPVSRRCEGARLLTLLSAGAKFGMVPAGGRGGRSCNTACWRLKLKKLENFVEVGTDRGDVRCLDGGGGGDGGGQTWLKLQHTVGDEGQLI